MIEEKIREAIQFALQSGMGISKKVSEIEVSRPSSKENGDFSTNLAFKLAKELKKTPDVLAKEIADVLEGEPVFAKVETVNGFINLFLDKKHYRQTLEQILKEKEHYGDLDLFKDKKVQVEFISANPTGPLTLGNGRGGFGGDVLANVLTKAGAKVQREYYVNDGGNQVRVLGDSLKVAAGKMKPEGDVYSGPYIEDLATKYRDDLEKDSFELGQRVSADILENLIKPAVKKMEISFDDYFHEKDLIARGEVEEVIEKFKEYKTTVHRDGALWFKASEHGDNEDRVLVKTDGEKTYFANDVAYHFDKLYKRKFDKVVNFWGADHQGHVTKMQAAVSAMGCPGFLDIVVFQLVRLIKDGKEFKMSKRKGTFVTTDDLLELIGGGREAADVARFFFLSRSFNTHMDFDLDLAKERSEKNPVFYVKYAYARLSGILGKAKDLELPKANLALLTEEAELELIDQLSQLPNLIASVATFEGYPVQYLPFYAQDTAKKFHYFYDKCRVIDEENPELTAARLELVEATKIVLGIVMRDLIGIETPEKM